MWEMVLLSFQFTVLIMIIFVLIIHFKQAIFLLQFQQTGTGNGIIGALANPASYNPQPLISSLTVQSSFGVVVLTIEFVKYSK